ncbi:hypothetical protein ACS0TY_024292 [Phlomoides rotata]
MICQHTAEKVVVVNVDSVVPLSDHSSHASNGSKSLPRPDGNLSTESQKQTCDIGLVEFSGKGKIPTYEMCPKQSRKSYLSNKWGEIMNDSVGLEFEGGATEFRAELIKYTTALGFKFKYVRNDSRYIHTVCNEDNYPNCPWFIKAKRRKVNNHFVVSKVNLKHECIGTPVVQNKTKLGVNIIGNLALQSVKSNPTITPKQIILFMKDSYGINLSYWKAWRIVEAARTKIFGSYELS